MKKYLQLAKITFEEYFVYRLNFVLWRFRSFVSFLTLFFFWLAIFANKTQLLGYQRSQILAYVIGIAFLRSIVLGSRSADMTGQIRSGELTKVVLSPFNIFSYWLSKDFVDKMLNVFFTIGEILIVVLIFNFPFYVPANFTSVLLFFVSVILAVFLYFFLSMSLAITAFWTEEIWATRWLFGVIFLEFFAGAFFPIDVLPSWLSKIIYLTPFPYLVFFPIKIWLGQFTGALALKAILICLVWLIFFYWLAHFLWKKGVKNYGAYGG